MKTDQRTQVLATALSVLLSTAASLRADVLAYWDMQATPSANKLIPTSVGSGLTAGSLALVNLNAPGELNLSFDTADKYVALSRSSTTGGSSDLSLGAALAEATYFSLTLTPDLGQALTISSLSFDCFAGTAGPSDRRLFLFSNKVGYTSGDLLFGAGTADTPGGTFPGSPIIPYNTATSDQNFFIDLSGNSAFANITDSVTFRIYLRTPTVSQNLAFDNLTVNGTVIVVPEPSSLVLLGIGGLGLVAIRRRHQK